MNDDKLREWMRLQVKSITQEGAVRRFELWFTAPGDSQRIAVAEIEEGAGIEDVCTALVEAAENDAGTRAEGLPHRYTVGCFRGDAPDPTAQHAMLVTAPQATGHFGLKLPELSPTETTQLAGSQQLRHTETLHRMLIETQHHTTGYLAQELQKTRAVAEKQQEQLLGMFEAMQNLEDRKLERELERARSQAAERRHSEVMGLVMSVAPMLLAQFAGGLGLPGAGVARDAGIQKFLKGLTEKEVMGILGALKPENQMVLMEVYKAYQANEKETQEELHPMLREPTDVH